MAYNPRPPLFSVPLLRALWSLLDGVWGVLKGSWGVLGKPVAYHKALRTHISRCLGPKAMLHTALWRCCALGL